MAGHGLDISSLDPPMNMTIIKILTNYLKLGAYNLRLIHIIKREICYLILSNRDHYGKAKFNRVVRIFINPRKYLIS